MVPGFNEYEYLDITKSSPCLYWFAITRFHSIPEPEPPYFCFNALWVKRFGPGSGESPGLRWDTSPDRHSWTFEWSEITSGSRGQTPLLFCHLDSPQGHTWTCYPGGCLLISEYLAHCYIQSIPKGGFSPTVLYVVCWKIIYSVAKSNT